MMMNILTLQSQVIVQMEIFIYFVNTFINQVRKISSFLNKKNYILCLMYLINLNNNSFIFLVPKKILSVLNFKDNSFEIIDQTIGTFDNATSIAFDWITEYLYWSEKIQFYNETYYSIKVVGPNYKKPKFIVTSNQVSSIVKIHIHPKRR